MAALDEDEIHKAAVFVRHFGADLESTITAADKRINSDVFTSSTSQAVAAYADAWNQNRS